MQKKETFRLKFSNDENLFGIAAHSEIELLYLLEGTVDIQVEQKLSHMKKDDILVINPDRRRSVQYVDKPLMMHLMIDYATVRDSFQDQDVLFWCDSTVSENERFNELRNHLRLLIRHSIQIENYESGFSFLSDCYEILHLLTFHFMVRAADVQWNEEGDRFEERLFKINNYINSNYDQPISIKDLSEKLFLSIGYLSRFFKKNYGMNFANYLTNVRLVHATDELLYTNISVTRVAYDCGFTSAAIFNKAFKKAYNVTPTEFRKQSGNEESTATDTPVREELETYLEKIVLNDDLPDSYEDQNLREKTVEGTYSAADTSPLSNYWGDTINFGDASNLLDSSMREHLIILNRNLHFRYVRVWSIFSREFFIRPGQEHYDFSQIDSVIDFILELHLKPFLDLGMKPRTLHFEVGVSDKKQMGEDFTCEQWGKLMPLFLFHLRKRYGKQELNDWRMELWFEEDDRENREAWKNYLEKFRISYDAIKSCNSRIQFGAYGLRIDYGWEIRREFLKYWKKTTPLPDFLSIMYYGYERGADGMDIHSRRTTDDENFIHNLHREKDRLKEIGLDHLPIYICEWNLTPSVRNIINDTCYKGSYIIRNILDVFGEVQSMGYGAGSDRQHSSYDTTGMLFGGTGLLTKEGIYKPAAFALSFMNSLLSQLIGKGPNHIVTTDGYNNYVIVCHNQQKLNDTYYLTPETQIQKDALWKYFDNMSRLKLHIILQDVPDGSYKMNILRVNRQYGSILDIWEAAGYENDLSLDELKHLKKICEPYIVIKKAEAVQNTLVIQEELQPNEFAFIAIRRE